MSHFLVCSYFLIRNKVLFRFPNQKKFFILIRRVFYFRMDNYDVPKQ
ncbi:hypothetical protein LINPERHAP1_LOCUS31817 [Linum perenne]